MSERAQPNRWRCLQAGCNPVLDAASATAHRTATGHRVARWPVRSPEGQRKARQRNRSGYYDRYNVGAKSRASRSPLMAATALVPSDWEPSQCTNRQGGGAFDVAGEFGGFEDETNCGYCSWCEKNDEDGGSEYAWGEDDF